MLPSDGLRKKQICRLLGILALPCLSSLARSSGMLVKSAAESLGVPPVMDGTVATALVTRSGRALRRGILGLSVKVLWRQHLIRMESAIVQSTTLLGACAAGLCEQAVPESKQRRLHDAIIDSSTSGFSRLQAFSSYKVSLAQ